jgi:hypothetical protein
MEKTITSHNNCGHFEATDENGEVQIGHIEALRAAKSEDLSPVLAELKAAMGEKIIKDAAELKAIYDGKAVKI